MAHCVCWAMWALHHVMMGLVGCFSFFLHPLSSYPLPSVRLPLFICHVTYVFSLVRGLGGLISIWI